ncbi:NAD(P)/FAD-dependent oxidoreductase [Aquisalinus flavus]|uniref:Pyridine nucleotide-disulfide oxidoreductase n=1 Tax=Aquisalinus flavus TaxID=1526572 RepID=A0A8J2V319_9PROT|nr:FAD/NAD(P)-binding oxidoreductase [Aquisalinus flavus]GGD07593.1 pyridine nucleotide-disulfide oxidoreductase [Aquisalinus flavus]
MSRHDVIIIGGGAAGLSTAASLLSRRRSLDIVIVEPAPKHYYQPGWTLVGGGVFKPQETEREMKDLIPSGARWKKAAVTEFFPERNAIALDNGEELSYEALVVAPGLKLNWAGIAGLEDALGRNGVTSNYRYDLAPYTWELVQTVSSGRALFTQPPMPIKCAGAPQKAMYLSCDAWLKRGVLEDIDVEFHNAGGVLFGVQTYVPALMDYVEKYGIDLCFFDNLISVDGDRKVAAFERKRDDKIEIIERGFDMIHVCPPQTAPDFIARSPLANEAGWVDVDQHTMTHNKYANIFGLGDAASTPNAKTAAAARKQAPIVAVNTLQHLDGKDPRAMYDGYGSCPLTVERGKIVLAEFGYGGTLLPSFPSWLLDGTKATGSAWFLKERMLPPIYWKGMLKGKEWMVKPKLIDQPL